MTAKLGTERLGYGTAGMPGPLTKREALRLLEAALDAGVRHFDTARMYGDGGTEALLGELVKRRRAEMLLVTKAGIAPVNRWARKLNALMPLPRATRPVPEFGRFRAEQIRTSVETSLRKLRTEQLDGLLLHEVSPADVTPDLGGVLERLRTEGKIARYGIATSIACAENIIAAHPELCSIVQVCTAWLDRPRLLPPGACLVVHSVFAHGLSAAQKRAMEEPHLARTFKEEAGFDITDTARLGRLLLQATIDRNATGVTLFSSLRADRIRANVAAASAAPNPRALSAVQALLPLAEPPPRREAAKGP